MRDWRASSYAGCRTCASRPDFDIADRIKVYYQAGPKLAGAVESFRDYIMGEVLATEMLAQAAPPEAYSPDEEVSFEGEQVKLGLLQVTK